MSIGRDIYCDTRLILQKLEKKFPSSALGATEPDQKALVRLYSEVTTSIDRLNLYLIHSTGETPRELDD